MIIFPALDTCFWHTSPQSYSHRTALWHFTAVGLTGYFKYIGPAIPQERKANWICRVYWQFSRVLLVAGIRVSFITFRTSALHRVWGLALWKYQHCQKQRNKGFVNFPTSLKYNLFNGCKLWYESSHESAAVILQRDTRQQDSHTFETRGPFH